MKKISKRKNIQSSTGRAHIPKKDRSLEYAKRLGGSVGPPNSLVSALSAKDRKVVKKRVECLLYSFHNCELYLTDYLAGRQNVHKSLATVACVQMAIDDVFRDVIEKYKFGVAPRPEPYLRLEPPNAD